MAAPANVKTMMYDAFGDESCGEQWVAYGVVVVPETEAVPTERLLAEVKVASGGKPSDPIHCRELLHPSARAKTPWAHLGVEGVFELYGALATEIGKAGLRTIAATARKSDFPDGLPPLLLQHVDPTFVGPGHATKAVPITDKQLAVLCSRASMIPLAKEPGLDRVRFWPDPDTTSVKWWDGNRQASQINFFIDQGSGREPPKINQRKVDPYNKPVALEIADFIAYVTQRSSGEETPNNRRFKTLARAFRTELVRVRVGI